MKAKLQKQLAYMIAEDAINELGWEGGQEVKLTAKSGQLVVKPKSGKHPDGVE